MSNMILERRYYVLDVKLSSPMNISSGNNEFTDVDVLRNGAGDVFIPGTSLAGAFRNYFGQQKIETGIFGFSKDQNGKMSSIHISDMYFDERPIVSERDGIKLDEQKRVTDGKKYDMEIIETGAAGKIYLQFIKREEDKADDNFDSVIYKLVNAIQEGEIRLGGNKNRGLGRLSVEKVYEKKFDYTVEEKDNLVDEWLEFVPNRKDITAYEEIDVNAYAYDFERQYIKMTIPLKQKGGISIRSYSATPGKADYEHITCNGEPVVPGTSWNGAIRSQIKKILSTPGLEMTRKIESAERKEKCSPIDGLLQIWFGYEVEKNQENRQSYVVIGESVIKGAELVPITRANINRFSSATVTNALYSEIACFNGITSLEILISKKYEYYQAVIGMLLLVIQDLQNGYLSIGGQASIGRGLFEQNGDILFSEELDEKVCAKALYDFLYEVG